MGDLQNLLQNNQLDANLVNQILASQVNKPVDSNGVANQAAATKESSLSELLNSFNEASANKDSAGSDIANTNKRLFLEAQVQPVQRQNDSINDDELFKFFEVDNLLGDDTSGGDNALGSADVTKKINEMVRFDYSVFPLRM